MFCGWINEGFTVPWGRLFWALIAIAAFAVVLAKLFWPRVRGEDVRDNRPWGLIIGAAMVLIAAGVLAGLAYWVVRPLLGC